jgi:hypothetical protein
MNAAIKKLKDDGTYETLKSIFILGEELDLPKVKESTASASSSWAPKRNSNRFEFRNYAAKSPALTWNSQSHRRGAGA